MQNQLTDNPCLLHVCQVMTEICKQLCNHAVLRNHNGPYVGAHKMLCCCHRTTVELQAFTAMTAHVVSQKTSEGQQTSLSFSSVPEPCLQQQQQHLRQGFAFRPHGAYTLNRMKRMLWRVGFPSYTMHVSPLEILPHCNAQY